MRWTLNMSFVNAALAGLLFLFTEPSTRAQQASPLDSSRFDSEIATFEKWDRKNAWPKDPILFVGSSSIRLWPTAESFPGLPVINRGFGGSQISDVNHFAERIVFKYQPRLIVFYAGDNDIADGKSPQKVFDGFRAFSDLLHERLPDTRIIYLPIKPSIARWKLWPQMQQANSLVERFAKSNERVAYIDTTTPMLGDDGQPRRDLFLGDDLHMNDRGYSLWTDILAAHLKSPP